MPPKSTFTRENVIDAAIQVIREQGWAACSARTIAKKMGSSTMPVYSAMGSMEALASTLQAHVQEQIVSYQVRKYTGNVFVNMAIGYVLFARDEPNLFRFAYVENGEPTSLDERHEAQRVVLKKIGDEGAAERLFASLSQEQIDRITLRTWIFVHGLAMLVNGRVLDLTEDDIRKLIEENGTATALWELGLLRRA